MSAEMGAKVRQAEDTLCEFSCSEQLQHEFQHMTKDWGWIFSFGLLMMVCGVAAMMFPILTTLTTVAVLGVTLIIAGIATIVTTAWTGKWSGMLVQLLAGILYITVGFMITDMPVKSAGALTLFLASFFIVIGLFRMVAAMMTRFPCWGWALLNGAVTFLLGMVIYRHFPEGAIAFIGILVGVELLFSGWTWVIMGLSIQKIPMLRHV